MNLYKTNFIKYFKQDIDLQKILHNDLKIYNDSGYGGSTIAEWPFYHFINMWIKGNKENARYNWVDWLVSEFSKYSLEKKQDGGMLHGSVHHFAVNSLNDDLELKKKCISNPILIKKEYIEKGAQVLVDKRIELISSILKNGYNQNLSDPIFAIKKKNMYILKGGHHRAAVLFILSYNKLPDVIIHSEFFWKMKTCIAKIKKL